MSLFNIHCDTIYINKKRFSTDILCLFNIDSVTQYISIKRYFPQAFLCLFNTGTVILFHQSFHVKMIVKMLWVAGFWQRLRNKKVGRQWMVKWSQGKYEKKRQFKSSLTVLNVTIHEEVMRHTSWDFRKSKEPLYIHNQQVPARLKIIIIIIIMTMVVMIIRQNEFIYVILWLTI